MKKFILVICLLLLSGCVSQHSSEQSTDNKQIWKKLCSEKHRFEIQYPANWINNLSFISDKNEGYQAQLETKDVRNRSSFSVFTTLDDLKISEESIIEKKQIKMLGKSAISYTLKDKIITNHGAGNDSTSYQTKKRIVLEKDKMYFHFMLNNITDDSKKILDDIYSSFRFLSDSEKCQETYKPGTVVLNDKIYYYGNEIGTYLDKKISISFLRDKYSFSGVPENLSEGMMDGVYLYKNMKINLPIKSSKEVKVIYECSSPLLASSPYFYCDTNGKDYLEQYEFGKDFRQFSTGGGFSLKWKKIYIKNIEGQDIVFEGVLDGDTYDISAPTTQKEKDRLRSKKYLDKIIQSPSNRESEKIWNGIVNSFSLEKE